MSRGGYAPDVLRAAAFFVDRSQSPVEALERAIAFAGPGNYCPELVGSMGGPGGAWRVSRRTGTNTTVGSSTKFERSPGG